MTADEVKALVAQGIEAEEIRVQGEGDRFEILVVAEAFEGLSRVRKQQMVYGCISDALASGSIHAVSIQAYTPPEWARARRMGLA